MSCQIIGFLLKTEKLPPPVPKILDPPLLLATNMTAKPFSDSQNKSLIKTYNFHAFCVFIRFLNQLNWFHWWIACVAWDSTIPNVNTVEEEHAIQMNLVFFALDSTQEIYIFQVITKKRVSKRAHTFLVEKLSRDIDGFKLKMKMKQWKHPAIIKSQNPVLFLHRDEPMRHSQSFLYSVSY